MTDDAPWKALKALPDEWQLIAGADTGTYMNAALGAIPPGDEPFILILAEFPNYRYVAHEIELTGFSIPEWTRWVMKGFHHFCPKRERLKLWADPNTQFRAELAHYGLDLVPNTRKLELRVEVTREYMQSVVPEGRLYAGADRLQFAPWLSIIPYEIEHAKWPDGTTGAGKFERIKEHDHGLDCVEHICSRRPRSRTIFQKKSLTFKERYLQEHRIPQTHIGDTHLGPL